MVMPGSTANRVVVVGGGPVGLTVATLLARAGVTTTVLERQPSLPSHPQAHFINCRTMEIFKHAFPSTLWQAIQKEVPPLRYWREFSFCTTMLGREIGRVDHYTGCGASEDRPWAHPVLRSLSGAGVAHLSQKRLMPFLLEQAQSTGVEVLLGHEVESYEEDDSCVHVRIKRCEGTTSGSSSNVALACDYLLAADGANSRTRSLAGINMVGDKEIQHLINVHFSSSSLARAIADRPAMLYFVYNQDVVSVMVAHHYQSGEFVCQLIYFPPVQSPSDFTESVCRDLVNKSIGATFSDITIHSIKPWVMHCQVAERYRKGRLFLVGDSAHRFPPAGGFGMNTGVQDAHNLAWNLSHVIQGHAPFALLDTYQEERKPAAVHYSQLSHDNFKRLLRVPQALGLDSTLPHTLATQPGMSKVLFNTLSSLGRRPLQSLQVPNQPYGEKILQQARQVLRDGASLPLIFPQSDLGYRYSNNLSTTSTTSGEALRVPVVGARCPHMRLALKGSSSSSSSSSTTTTTSGSSSDVVFSATDLPDQVAVMMRGETGEPTLAKTVIISMHSSSSSSIPQIAGLEDVVRFEVCRTTPTSSGGSDQVVGVLGDLPSAKRAEVVEVVRGGGVVEVVDVYGDWGRVMGGGGVVAIRPDGRVIHAQL